MIDQIEIRHLRYFVAVAEELHFGRAAKRLGITQPPLSLSIQRLESALGVALFERTNRRVQLTPAGRTLLEEGRHLIADLMSVVDATRRSARGETGSLTIAYAASVMHMALPRIIQAFRKEFPDVRLELRELPTSSQIIELRAGELDVGFLRQTARDPELMTETMMTENLVLAISKHHELAARKHLRLEDVANEDFVLFPRDLAPGLYAHVLAVCAEVGVHPRVVQTSRELYTTISLVEAGLGVTIIPESVQQMGWRGVRYYPIKSPLAATRIDAAWRADNRSPILPAFLEITRAMAHSSVPES
jgi:DNA-binding transcriptional LysR family regulator